MAARWLLWRIDWTDNNTLDCTEEPIDVIEGSEGDLWIGLDSTGDRVKVPCSPEEALEAAGWGACPPRDVFIEWRKHGHWRTAILVGDDGINHQLGGIDEWWPEWTDRVWRPEDERGNYAPEGWGTKGD